MENKNIVMRIKMLIEHKMVSPSKFANMINFNQSNLSKVLKGDRNVPPNLINAICEKLDVPYKWIVNGEGPMFTTGDINQTFTGTASNNSGGTNIGVISGDVINGTDPDRQERREMAQEEHENSLLDTINTLISIKTQQGVQEHELLIEMQKMRDVLKDIISMDGRYQQMLDVNLKLQEMNEKLLSIIDRLTEK